jgi:adenylosuccinate synthase
VVLDPWALRSEIERLEGQGVSVTPENLVVADNCPLILPIHSELDVMREAAAGKGKIGTTGRGIGPAYEDKVARRAVRLADILQRDRLAARLGEMLDYHNFVLSRYFSAETIDFQRSLDELVALA